MNWDTLKKCILILVLGCCVNLIWLVWETYVLLNSEYWHVVNVQLLRHKLVINSIFFITLLGLIYPLLCPTKTSLGTTIPPLYCDWNFNHFTLL